MLELRPNCELCDRDLPPDSDAARICSYECTYCADCVETRLFNVCPTCGGGFAPRPVRPRKSWRQGKSLGLEFHPASSERVHSKYSDEDIAAHVRRIRDIPPASR
ncbi:MAG: urease [Rhodobacteraceae bacterium]|nr:urease [Paracoccaceae bacterium]